MVFRKSDAPVDPIVSVTRDNMPILALADTSPKILVNKAVYGVLDEGAVAQPVIAPTVVFTQFGGLEITTSSTALQALTDAVLYLGSYPFECSEQLGSRVMSVASLRGVLSAFKAAGLPYISGHSMTPKGLVSVYWDPSALILETTIPAGVTAEVVLPEGVNPDRISSPKGIMPLGGGRYQVSKAGRFCWRAH